jgi:lysophospholipase L1-like esterase
MQGWIRRIGVLGGCCLALAAWPAGASAIAVSIGDSFSTGAGAGRLDPGTDPETGDGCSRSRDAWPRLLGVSAADHFACAGATVESLELAQKSGRQAAADQGSQLDRLRSLAAAEPVTRVYVTIGLNDLGFGPILASCVLHTCLGRLHSEQFPFLENNLAPATTAALKLARRAAPAAQVILVGYPQLFPKRAAPGSGCAWLTPLEAARFRELQAKLDSTLGGAAAAAGAFFVSVRGAFRPHELCSGRSWVEPITEKSRRTGEQVLGHAHHGGHPNRAGQHALARWVRRAQIGFGSSIHPPPPTPRPR